MVWFGYRVRLEVSRPAANRISVARRVRRLLVALVAGAIALLPLGPASADDRATMTFSVSTGIRSLTLSTANLGIDHCNLKDSPTRTGTTLTLPNGTCITTTYDITNGPAVSHIFVSSGDNAMPTDGGKPWSFCTGNACTGPNSVARGGPDPGADQWYAATTARSTYGADLGSTPKCDRAFNPTTPGGGGQPAGDCLANPGDLTAFPVQIYLMGPATSTDNSGTFTITVTYWAAP